MTDKITEERLAEIDNDACDQMASEKYGWCADLTAEEAHALILEIQSLRSAQASQAGEVEVVAYEVTDKLTAYDFKRRSARLASDPWIPSALLDTERFGLEPLVTLASRQSVIAAKDAEIERLQASHNENAKLRGQRDAALALIEAAEARANAAEAAIHLIQEEAEKDNSPLGRSDSLALERIRTVLSTLNGAKP